MRAIFHKDLRQLPGSGKATGLWEGKATRAAAQQQIIQWAYRKDILLARSGNLHWIRQWSPAARDCPRASRSGGSRRDQQGASDGALLSGGRYRVKWFKLAKHISTRGVGGGALSTTATDALGPWRADADESDAVPVLPLPRPSPSPSPSPSLAKTLTLVLALAISTPRLRLALSMSTCISLAPSYPCRVLATMPGCSSSAALSAGRAHRRLLSTRQTGCLGR